MTTELKLELLQAMTAAAVSFEEKKQYDLAKMVYEAMSKLD
jgi:hypothetical protein